MDVHKETIAVAYVAPDYDAEVTYLGTIGTRQGEIDQLVRKMPSQAQHLIFVYEAGPCGSWLSRSLTNKTMTAGWWPPHSFPKKPVTASQPTAGTPYHWSASRAGDLTAVSVPQVAEEAMRDLTRVREDTLSDLQDATCRLNAFLLRHDSRSTGQAPWGPAPLRWLAEVVCPTPAQHSVFQAYVRAVTEHPERRQRLDQEHHEHVHAWRWHAVGAALQALRGVPGTVAVTMGADIGDLTRFDTPRERMQCLGLIPAAYASGERRHQGAITKAGNTQARRALVEGAWAYCYPAQVSRPLPLRLAKQPKMIQDISWQAHVRLGRRYRHLVARGKPAHIVTVAMARERAGFKWAMATQLPVAVSAYKDRVPLAPQRSRLPTCLRRGAAPVWCNPRQR
jgi:transposase